MVQIPVQNGTGVVSTTGAGVRVDPLAGAYDLPCTLVLEAPVVDFTVGTLMSLRPGCIVRTAAQHNEDLSLKVNGQIVGLVEFDVIGDTLAVRLTRVA